MYSGRETLELVPTPLGKDETSYRIHCEPPVAAATPAAQANWWDNPAPALAAAVAPAPRHSPSPPAPSPPPFPPAAPATPGGPPDTPPSPSPTAAARTPAPAPALAPVSRPHEYDPTRMIGHRALRGRGRSISHSCASPGLRGASQQRKQHAPTRTRTRRQVRAREPSRSTQRAAAPPHRLGSSAVRCSCLGVAGLVAVLVTRACRLGARARSAQQLIAPVQASRSDRRPIASIGPFAVVRAAAQVPPRSGRSRTAGPRPRVTSDPREHRAGRHERGVSVGRSHIGLFKVCQLLALSLVSIAGPRKQY